MRVSRLELNNYRVYDSALLLPPDGVTVLCGNNAQGKTAVLEAVYLCCTGRSHRTARDKELIKWGCDRAKVSLDVDSRGQSSLIEITLNQTSRKSICVDSKPIERSGDLMGHVMGVLFSPEDLRIVKEGPGERRRFLDMLLSQIRPAYYFNLQRYIRALNQRGALLREATLNSAAMATIPEWNDQLARYGAKIIDIRREFLGHLGLYASKIHASLTSEKEKLDVDYQMSVKIDSSGENLYSDMLKAIESRTASDIKRGITSIGPHRDDISLMIDGNDARIYASQGQQRSCALSLKLSEIDVMREATGESPILLLDDVMSELDPARRRMLLSAFEGVQTIVTCTDPEDLSGAKTSLIKRVDAGRISD